MNNGLVYKTQTRWLFHAHIKIKIPVFCDDGLFDELFSVLELVDKQYNSYSKDSYFDRINKSAGHFVEVDDVTIFILKRVLYFSELFDGEYDITVMPLIRLWGFYKDDIRRLPSAEEIRDTRKKVDYNNIEIDGSRVRIASGQEIITGSFIKSYAVDQLVRKIKNLGITDAIINAGGSTIRSVNNTVHPCWQVDIPTPDDEGTRLFKLKLSNMCFSTSAQSKTFVEIDNKRYGHIISPKTGYPSENKQIGILTEDCFMGDIISTGLYNCTLDGFEEKMKKISEHIPVSGFLVDKDNDIRIVGDFEKHIID